MYIYGHDHTPKVCRETMPGVCVWGVVVMKVLNQHPKMLMGPCPGYAD